ncbi:MAG: DUF5815 family protein [Halococcoides sp.]
MPVPGVPTDDDPELELPCGETVDAREFDLNTSEIDCECGEAHGVVLDTDPLTRFVPDQMARILEETVKPRETDHTFGTLHAMGMLADEVPQTVASADVSENGDLGFNYVWVSDFTAREVHVLLVQLLVDLMDHAVDEVGDDSIKSQFTEQLEGLDVEEFVDQYRTERSFEGPEDSPV